nr:hypothetical protein [Tanacetum cinerariifolium]
MDVDVVRSDGIEVDPEIQAEIDECIAYAEGVVEVTHETLGDLVQRFHDHTVKIPVHRVQAIEDEESDRSSEEGSYEVSDDELDDELDDESPKESFKAKWVVSVNGVPWVGDGGVSGISLPKESSVDERNGEVAGSG